MDYNVGIGLGGALSRLGPGILQGEEIGRRRTREDEEQARLRAEFENRQTMFGRQKQMWQKEDSVGDLTAQYLAGNLDEPGLYQGMAGAGAGQEALNLRGVLQGQEQNKQSFEMNKKSFDLNYGEALSAAQDRELVRSFYRGDTSALTNLARTQMQERAKKDPTFVPPDIIDVGLMPEKSKEGLTQVYYREKGSDGKVRTNTLDVMRAGAFLGSQGLMALGDRERTYAQNERALSAQAAVGRKSNEIAIQRLNFEQRKEQAAEFQKRIDKLEGRRKIAQEALSKGLNNGNVNSVDIAKLDREIAVEEQRRDAAFQGYDVYPKVDPKTNEVVGVERRRSIYPKGNMDEATKIDWRPDDNSLHMNADNVPRVMSMVNPRLDGETQPAYMDRLKRLAKAQGVKPGWVAVMQPPAGLQGAAPVVVNTGHWSDPEVQPDNVKALLSRGWTPVLPPNFDLGTAYRMPDAQEAARSAERAGETKASSGVRVGRSSGAVGGRGVLPSTQPVTAPPFGKSR
jgi:hypothetical protein